MRYELYDDKDRDYKSAISVIEPQNKTLNPDGTKDNTKKFGIMSAAPAKPAVPAAGKNIYGADPNTDYQALINNAENMGDYAAAQNYEKLRNEKIGMLGLPYKATDKFNYLDPYSGERDRIINQIDKRAEEGFNYDYETDPRYKQLLNQKTKESDTQFQNGMAALASRFGGEVPANLVGQLLREKQNTIDSADSYIPQLYELARSMYDTDTNNLYKRYNMAAQKSEDDYNKWLTEREFRTGGMENAYNRRYTKGRNAEADRQWQASFDRGNMESDREYDYRGARDAVNDQRYNDQWNMTKEQWDWTKALQQGQYNDDHAGDIASLAASLTNKYGWDTALALARSFYGEAQKFPDGNFNQPAPVSPDTPVQAPPAEQIPTEDYTVPAASGDVPQTVAPPTQEDAVIYNGMDDRPTEDYSASVTSGIGTKAAKSGTKTEKSVTKAAKSGTKTESSTKTGSGTKTTGSGTKTKTDAIDLNGGKFVTLPNGKTAWYDKNGVFHLL